MSNSNLAALKALSEQLTQKEDELAAFFSLSPAWLLVCTPRDIVRCSLSMSRDLGYEVGELEGEPWSKFIDTVHAEADKQARDELLNQKPLTRYQNTWIAKDGSKIPVDWWVTPYMPGNILAYAVGVPRDE
jgi:PAS domain S-box-containing protein